MKPKTAEELINQGFGKSFDELSHDEQAVLINALNERKKSTEIGREPRSKGHSDGERSGGAEVWG